MPLPNDPLFNLQWFLKNTGQAGGTAGIDINVEKAWEDYTGTGVKVGVYDDGVEVTHPDLAANYNAALQPTINNVVHAGTPTGPNDNHGTPVAGLIVAKGNNGIGVVGVAYNATFGTARYLGAPGQTGSALLNQQTLYDVANHSWGTTRQWFNDGPVDPSFQSSANAGRNGLGTVMLKAAGNERVGAPGGDEPVGRDANDSANNTSRHLIIVGATLNTGFVAEYSSPSAALLVSAPAGPLASGLSQDITTDRSGTAGDNNGSGTPNGQPDYTSFNGTSAATPVTSGVAALILQANPNLGWRDVQEILAYSARHVGSPVAGLAQNNELDTWQFNAAKNWNGAGLHFSNDYGFGLVDATTAVRLAENWLALGQAQTSVNEVSATNGITQAALAIPDNNQTGLTFNITLTGAISIEQMALRIQLSHTAVGDLSIDLTSPGGVTSNMWLRTNAATAINADWTFASREFFGEAAAGTWTVRIRDLGALGTGEVGNVNLTAYGATLTADTHYIYTPEFATYTRSTLNDTAGIDIFDAGSLMTASTIDLRSGNTSNLVGKNLVISNGTIIEHAYGGDGNDTMFGNAVANLLRGGRGNDSEKGGDGSDTLEGGIGNDTLDGENDNDRVAGGVGNDLMFGGLGNDTMLGEADNDTIWAFDGDDNLQGGLGADLLFGEAGVDTMDGDDGADQLFGWVGNDLLLGGAGNDNLFGEQDNDLLFGWLGADSLYGGIGNDTLHGEQDSDLLGMDEGNDLAFGGDGNDTFWSWLGDDTVWGGTGNDLAFGDDGADLLIGEDGADTMLGGAGNDALYGWVGADVLWGGDGQDALWGEQDNDLLFGEAGNDVLLGIDGADTAYGWTGADSLYGWTGNDVLFGEQDNDLILGEDGDDVIVGGLGSDTMTGGAGADKFYFANFELAAGDVDRITDYDGADRYYFQTGTAVSYVSVAGGASIQVSLVGGMHSLDVAGATAAQLQAQTLFF